MRADIEKIFNRQFVSLKTGPLCGTWKLIEGKWKQTYKSTLQDGIKKNASLSRDCDFGDEESASSGINGATSAMSDLRIRKNASSNQRPVSGGGADEFDAFAAARSSTVGTTRKPSDTNHRSEDQAEGSLASLAQAKAQRDVTSANATTSPKTVAAAMPNELMGEEEEDEEEEMELFFADCC